MGRDFGYENASLVDRLNLAMTALYQYSFVLGTPLGKEVLFDLRGDWLNSAKGGDIVASGVN